MLSKDFLGLVIWTNSQHLHAIYMYADKNMTHLCILAAAIDGTATLGLKIDKRGLWSVTIVNC